jgi:hypothetical protein
MVKAPICFILYVQACGIGWRLGLETLLVQSVNSIELQTIYVFYNVWRYVRKDCSHRNKPLRVTTVEHEV